MGPGVRNLFHLLEGFAAPEVVEDFRSRYNEGTLRYVDLKATLADAMIAALTPVRERREELLADPRGLTETLRAGAERARAIARTTIAEVKERMGLSG